MHKSLRESPGLRQTAEIHLWNLANGCCGTAVHGKEEITRIRAEEARESAELAGGTSHPPLFDDKDWLDASQGMGAYLDEMERMGAAVGRMSGRFAHAEGWLRHNPLGFCPEDFNPIQKLLQGDCHVTTAQ